MRTEEFSVEVAGTRLVATFSDIASEAHGSVTLSSRNTVVLATAVMGESGRPGTDFLPLTVDYEERFYAVGHIPGARYVRREGKPSDEAILSARAVDRAIRPLFDQRIRNDVQVIITVLAIGDDDPDMLAINAASLALLTSDIPWNGPVSAVRVALPRAGGTLTVNPTYAERADGLALDLVACGKDGTVNMLEGAARELSETAIAGALETALEHLRTIEAFQRDIARRVRKEKRAVKVSDTPPALTELFARTMSEKIIPTLFSGAGKRAARALEDEWARAVAEHLPDAPKGAARALFADAVRGALHREAVAGRRTDGRAAGALRPLYAQAGGISPVLHGVGVFYRGGTHVLSVLTLGAPDEWLAVDSAEERGAQKRFMHHYNFPPFSAGETGKVGHPNRRMIGHGALAEKALAPVLPPESEFPYTVRVVSECLASNGSTSMASVCASSIALMDGGVPITAPVAGVAIGLMQYGGARVILTDIQGPEDEHGDMDFKVAGTADGVTALQLDVKIPGVPLPVLLDALRAARRAHGEILGVIASAIAGPRGDISPNAPEIITLAVTPENIGTLIGPGGKTLRRIRDAAGAQDIQIEEDGTVYAIGARGSAERAAEAIQNLTRAYAAGERFEATVARIVPFGAFVRINESREGLVHISDIAPFHIPRIEDVLTVGERVPVVVKEVDEKGRLALSIVAADRDFIKRKGPAPRA